MKSRATALQARADYARLGREYRERSAARGLDVLAADYMFSSLTVAKDCIDTEQMHGRWASEGLIAANADYAKVTELMDHLAAFLRKRRAARPSPAPKQRSGS